MKIEIELSDDLSKAQVKSVLKDLYTIASNSKLFKPGEVYRGYNDDKTMDYVTSKISITQ